MNDQMQIPMNSRQLNSDEESDDDDGQVPSTSSADMVEKFNEIYQSQLNFIDAKFEEASAIRVRDGLLVSLICVCK